MGSRIVAIGLEAADHGLIEAWCAEGRLPALASLRARGSWVNLRSTTEISSGTTWPSIYTGVMPARHGAGFYHRQLESGTYRLRKFYANRVRRDPFWVAPSKAGRKIAVFDVPSTYPNPGFNGVFLGGWGVEAPSWTAGSLPEELIGQVRERFGSHPLENWYQMRPSTIEEWKDLQDKLIQGAKAKGLVSKFLRDENELDLLLAVFSEPHWAAHLFWHLTDATHPEHLPGPAEVLGNPILNVYAELDRAIAEIVRDAPDCTVLVFSNTGMTANCSGIHLVPEVLRRLDVGPEGSNRKEASNARFDGASSEETSTGNVVMKVEGLVGPKTIQFVKRFVPERLWDTWTRRILQIGCDWGRSRAFALPNDYNGAIRINLAGREPTGRVAPGAEYDDLCNELIDEFSRLVNPDTGKPAVSRVFRVDREYGCDEASDLPDVIVKWAGDAPIRALASARIGCVRGNLIDKRTGAHTDTGFLLAAGTGIKRGARASDGHIVDIAPTILHLMGEPIPKEMDGKVLRGILEE